MNRISKYLAARRQRAEDDRRSAEAALCRDGFDYAAGELLRGRDPESIQIESDAGIHPPSFSCGMDKAIAAFEQLAARRPLAPHVGQEI